MFVFIWFVTLSLMFPRYFFYIYAATDFECSQESLFSTQQNYKKPAKAWILNSNQNTALKKIEMLKLDLILTADGRKA